MTSFTTESDIQMSAPGIPGRSDAGAGYSKLLSSSELRSLLGTGSGGAGTKFLADDSTWKAVDLSSYATTASVAAGYVALAGSYADPSWLTSLAWGKLTSVPAAVSSLSGTNTGDQDLSSYATTASVAAGYVALAGSYANPSWLTSLAWSKLTSVPAAVSALSGTNTGDQDLSSYLTSAAAAAAYQPLNTNLTAISGLTPTNDDFLQRKAGSWTNRNISQVKSDLGLTGTNSGDQTITLTGDVTGSGTGSFAATIADGAITLAKMASVATGTVFYRKTAGTNTPEVQTLATLKLDLGLTGTNSGDQTITLTGDVTGSGTGSFAATIADGAITLAKMASMATASLIYRRTAGTGSPEVQSLATLKSDLLLTGTNSGDQTSIVGISGTKNQFDASCSDGNFLYVGDAPTSHVHGNITNAGAIGSTSGLPIVTTTSGVLTTGSFGTTAGTFAAGNDSRITGALSSATAATTYVPYTGASTNVNLGTNSLSCGAITMDGLFTTQAMILTGTSHQAWFKALNTGGVFRIQADPTSGVGVNITSTALHPLDSNYTLGTSGAGFSGIHVGNSGSAALIEATTDVIVIRNAADSAAGGLNCGSITSSGAISATNLSGTNTGDQDLSAYLPLAGGALTGDVTSTSAIRIAGAANNGADFEVGSRSSGRGEIYIHGTSILGGRIVIYENTTAGLTMSAVSGQTVFSVNDVFSIDAASNGVLYHNSGVTDLFGSSVNFYLSGGSCKTRVFATSTTSTNYECYAVVPTTTDVKMGIEVGSAGGTATRTYRTGHWNSAGTFVDRNVLTTSSAEWWSDTNMILRMYAHGDINNGGILQSYKARGTDRNNKLYPVASDQLLGFNCYGWDENAGTWSGAKATWNISVPSTWTSTNNGTQHTWTTTDPTDATKTLQNRMRLHGNGNFTVGTITDASTRLHVLSTGTQLRLAYDSSNYVECSVSSAGAVTFNATGASAGFTFSDSVSVAAAITSSSGTGGLGYATGAGGTVTQATSKSTGVTLNKVTGTITMHNAAMTYNTKVSFVLTNSAIAATDMVVVQHESGGTVGYYFCTATPAAGSATITVYLEGFTAGTLSEAIVLRFVVIKSVNS